MTFVVETGAGVPGANAYATVAFVTSYLTARGRETENGWSAATTTKKEAAIVGATDFIEIRWGQLFLGQRLRRLISGRNADGSITLTNAPLNGEEVVIGTRTYRFVTALQQENDVLIGGSVATSIDNLVAAVNDPSSNSAVVHEDTFINYEVFATDGGTYVEFVALSPGENGNSIQLSTDITGATASAAFLAGGVDEGPQPLSFPRESLFDRSGQQVLGVPLNLRQATAEYAVRALASTLAPDPTIDSSMTLLQRKREKVGPIEEEFEFVAGGQPLTFRPYPAADRLLAQYVTPTSAGTGRAIRG